MRVTPNGSSMAPPPPPFPPTHAQHFVQDPVWQHGGRRTERFRCHIGDWAGRGGEWRRGEAVEKQGGTIGRGMQESRFASRMDE